MVVRKFQFTVVLLALFVSATIASGQCPQLFNFNGVPSSTPMWYSCNGASYSLNLQSPNNWGAYSINWGDGSALQTGSSWNSPTPITHLYAPAVATYTVTVTEISSGCTVTGTVVMEQGTSASIQIPVGGLTQACAPQVMEFTNSSTNVSPNTVFTWDFGDGSPPLTFDHTNWQQTISHLYDVGTVNCETVVSLVAQNYCNTIQGGPSTATFNPIRIWDLDDPGITASATLLCYPDTIVTFTNTTHRNCLFQGNIYQRYEYWNFGDYWGLGHDSIIDWTPWPPTFPRTMHYPGIGTYTVQLLDSNFCGIAPTSMTIQIVAPPVAGISASTTTVCAGQPITFFQQATGSPNSYSWNFGFGWITTGPGNITYTYNTPGTYTVQSRVSITGASSSCQDIATIQVVVLPKPAVSIQATPVVACNEADVTFTPVSANAVTWNWTFGTAPGTYSGADPPVVHYGAPGVYTATLLVTASNGCSASSSTQITIHPTPVPAFQVMNLCEGEVAQFWNASSSPPSSPITSWNWSFGDGSTSTQQHPQHLYQGTGTFNVALQVSNGHCQETVIQQVHVEARPVAAAHTDVISGCSPLTVEFTQSSSNASSYQWNLGPGGISDQETFVHTFTNTSGTTVTQMVILTVTNSFGCASSDTLYIEVHANAIASFTNNSFIPDCSPHNVSFTNTSLYASSYEWSFGDGASSLAMHPTHTYVNTTGFVQTYPVTLIALAANGCHDTISHPVLVFPIHTFSFDLTSASGCGPLNVQMPMLPGIQSYSWDFGDGNTSTMPAPLHQFVNNGLTPVTYTITLTGISPLGCTATASSEVTVYPPPVAQFIPNVIAGCSPLLVQLQNSSINANTYSWNYGDGQSSTSAAASHNHTFTNNSSASLVQTIQLTAQNNFGCASTYQTPVTVYPAVQASFNAPQQACSPAEINFTNTSIQGASYEWSFGNGLSSADYHGESNYQVSGNSPENFVVTLQVTSADGCSATASHQLTVNPLPSAGFSISESQACSPAPVVFTNTSTGATGYSWNYGDGTFSGISDSQHIHIYSHTGASPTSFNITLTAVSDAGCVATASGQFQILPSVVAGFTSNAQGCSPFTSTFVNQSTGATSFEWSFGDGSTSNATNPSHLYETNHTDDLLLTAQLIAYNFYGCSDTATTPITVNHTPLAGVLLESVTGCLPVEALFQNISIGADSYLWNYGNGQSSTTDATVHSATFSNFTDGPVAYPVLLTAYTTNGCSSQTSLLVNVPVQLTAAFASNAAGCTPLPVQFNYQGTGAQSWLWDFGDGTISNLEHPLHTYTNTTGGDVTYLVTLTTYNETGCVANASWEIHVFAQPSASFDVSPFIQTWPESTVQIQNTTTGGSLSYQWSFGDGATSSNPSSFSHTYSTWGTYVISLDAGNGHCSDSDSQEVIILPPVAVVDFLGPAEGCVPLTVQFTNLSQNIVNSWWQFGDGGTANATNPVYTYYQPGDYTVTLTATGLDGSTATLVQEYIIRVYPRALAVFTVTPNQISVPTQPIYCLNLSQQANQYTWDFGDGNTSNAVNPIHYYQSAGIFSVMLVANNSFNCPDTMLVVDAVHAHNGGMIDFPNAFTPRPTGGSGGAYDPMGYSNDVFFPLHQGVTEYQLHIFNKWGELLFESKDIFKGWDGYYRGNLCKQDVYVWKVKARFANGESFEKAGDVTLIIR